MPKTTEFKIPTSPAAIADLLGKTREDRLEADKKAAELKAREVELQNRLIDLLPVSDATGVAGKLWRVQVVEKERVQMDAAQWAEFYKYMSRTKRFDLLQKRVSDAAAKELLAAGKTIPGVKIETYKSVSLKKAGK